ncbi:disease resistance RPP13-like protein 4 [Cornus florida]|uniref:disease resistance RPP13-like protein 4 n=1 Tax=Cornus florida TaxID=4283 RepID=UPI00289C7160|nr:disease resistance RPP13-like protein 4 [Cornus florida]
MPYRRKPVDTVLILLSNVNEVIKRATNSNQADAVRSLLPRFTMIQNELNQIKDRFPEFNTWEENLMNEFKSLHEDIGDDIFENGTQTDKIDDKLKSIDDKLKNIKSLVDKLPTPDLTLSEQRALLEKQDRKVSNDWLDLNVEKNILVSPAIANLQLSYDVLEIQLKLCLLCLAVFPEKAVIKKRALIYWWIGESLVTKSGEKTAEEVGKEIFAKLIKKGLIQKIPKNTKSPIIDCCRMHPWIRRMLVSVATRGQFFDFNHTGDITHDYTNSRRACLVSGNQGFTGNTNSDSNADANSNTNSTEVELLTMFNVDEHYLSFPTDLFLKFKKLVILHLGRWQNVAKHHIEVENEEFLNELRSQKHLKYLSLQGMSRITAIPSSIVECVNLEILDLRACHNLEKLPNDISPLGKLTHLDVSECYLLESMPKGIEKLSSLQVLKGFVIGHPRQNPCKLGDLALLKRLRKLSIQIGSEATVHEAELCKLKEIVDLRVLTISWGMVVEPSAPIQQSITGTNSGGGGAPPQQKKLTKTATMTMKSLSFPPKLEKLDLRCFPRQLSPDWLKPSSLENLKKLYIRGGELDSLTPETGKKWKVQILRLKYLRNFKIKGSNLKDEFPDLRYFEKIKCNQLNKSQKNEPPINERQYDEDVEWNKEDGWDKLEAESPDFVENPDHVNVNVNDEIV